MELGKNASDTCAVLSKDYGGEAKKKSGVFEWHKRFKEGRENVEDDETDCNPRCHKTGENFEQVWNLVHSDRGLIIRTTAVQPNLHNNKLNKDWRLAQRLDSPP
jgi:hypothetical protein